MCELLTRSVEGYISLSLSLPPFLCSSLSHSLSLSVYLSRSLSDARSRPLFPPLPLPSLSHCFSDESFEKHPRSIAFHLQLLLPAGELSSRSTGKSRVSRPGAR